MEPVNDQFIVYVYIYVQYVPATGATHSQQLFWHCAAASEIHDPQYIV